MDGVFRRGNAGASHHRRGEVKRYVLQHYLPGNRLRPHVDKRHRFENRADEVERLGSADLQEGQQSFHVESPEEVKTDTDWLMSAIRPLIKNVATKPAFGNMPTGAG